MLAFRQDMDASTMIGCIHSFGQELPNVSSCPEVHHRLVACLHGEQLRNLHVSASAQFPAHHLPHRFPEHFLLVFLPGAVAKEMFSRVHCSVSASAPPALVIFLVSESP